LAQNLDFDLYVAPPRRLLDDTKTLEGEELVPAAKIHVSWKVGATPVRVGPAGYYLRKELFSEGDKRNAASAFPNAKTIVDEQKAQISMQGRESSDNSGGGAQSKEELLVQRMLGKKVGLLGGRKPSSESSDKESEKKTKPKWFSG
jgi:hypothetical protein